MQPVDTSISESPWPWPALEFDLEPASTALLVIDFQNQFDEILNRDSGRGSHSQPSVVDNATKLVRFFREKQMRVVFLTTGPELPDHRDLNASMSLHSSQLSRLYGQPVMNHRGTQQHAVVDELNPEPNEPVVNKLSANGMLSTNLDPILRNLGVESLVIIGLNANTSVESTARGASDLGYRCVVIEDALNGHDSFLQRQTLRNYLMIFGRVQTTEGIIAELSGERSKAKQESADAVSRVLSPQNPMQDVYRGSANHMLARADGSLDQTALLVVDMQYFCHPGHGMAAAMDTVRPDASNYRGRRFLEFAVPNCRRLLDTFRARGGEVIFLTIGPELPDGTTVPVPMLERNRQRSTYAGRQVSFPCGTFEHSVVEELRPKSNEAVVNKLTASAFMTSKLDQVLRNLQIRDLLIGGVATNACVESTARDAADLGYRCTLVDDACAAFDSALQEATMRTYSESFGLVRMTDELIELLSPQSFTVH